MALLDFMKQGTQWLTDNTGMDWNKVQSDPGLAAKRLMGAPVDLSSQQGTGFSGFSSLLGDSNNMSKEAVAPLPRMDVTGTVGGPSMTPYQSQEIAPSHLGAVTQDFSEAITADLPNAGSYNTYNPYTNERIINNYEPIATQTGRERTRFANDERLTEENSPAKVGLDELVGKVIPKYNLTTNSFKDGLEVTPGQGTLYDFDDANFSGTEQIIAGNTPTDTKGFPSILGEVDSGTEAENKAKDIQNTINNKTNTTFDAEQNPVLIAPNNLLGGTVRNGDVTTSVPFEYKNVSPDDADLLAMNGTTNPLSWGGRTNPEYTLSEDDVNALKQQNNVVTPKEVVQELSMNPTAEMIINNEFYSDAKKIAMLQKMGLPIPDSLGK